jgi:hypothetical protein
MPRLIGTVIDELTQLYTLSVYFGIQDSKAPAEVHSSRRIAYGLRA